MATVETESRGRFGNALATAMAHKNMSLRELAEKTEGTYEHMRKLLKGMAYPSKYLLKSICDVLGLKLTEMQKLVDGDKMEHKFGKNAYTLLGKDPRMSDLEQVIPHLSDEQLEMFVTQMKAVMKNNRRKA